MRNTWVSVSSWRLCTGFTVTRLSSHSVFQVFFSMTVFKREIISQSVLKWLKILVIFFFCAISEIQKVFLVLQACNFFISCSMESNLVADWWWTVWFDILFTFSQLLNLHPCCCSYAQTLDTICVIEIRDSFYFLTTCATFFRIMTPYFTMWVNKYSAKDSVYLVFARS